MAARTAAHCAPAAPSAPRQAVQLHACPQSRLLAQARAACGAPRAPPAAAPAAGEQTSRLTRASQSAKTRRRPPHHFTACPLPAGWRPRVQPRRFAAAARGAAAAAAAAPAQVVLTREQGKNGALRKVLEGRGISCLELPMVETVAGPDRDRLPEVRASRATCGLQVRPSVPVCACMTVLWHCRGSTASGCLWVGRVMGGWAGYVC